MNITKDFHEYISVVKNTLTSKYVLKTERYGVFDKCTRLLKQIEEVGRNLEAMSSMSKKSSPFNDIDFSNITGTIKRSLTNIEEEIKIFESRELKNLICSAHEKKSVYNTVELLRSRLQNLNLKFRKFLQNQSESIKEKIKRINNLTGAHVNTLSSKKPHNEFIYTSIPNKEEEDDIIDFNTSISTQSTMQSTTNRNQYYLDRTNAVQGIEKTMTELSQMFFRLGQMVNEQKSMIEKIDNNTDLSLKNVEEGLQELTHMQRDVRSNRKLLLKIFFILIITSVIYIILFT